VAIVRASESNIGVGLIPLTGIILDPEAQRFTGYLRLTLSYQACRNTLASNLIVAERVVYPVVNGLLPTGAIITPNDILQPQHTFYWAEYVSASGGLVATNQFAITGTGPFDIGQAQPTPVTTSNLSFNADLGAGVANVCNFPGADASQKIANAAASLPAAGGTIDTRCLSGNQVFSQDPFAAVGTKWITVIMGGAIFTSSVNVTVPATVHLAMLAGAVISMNAGTTLTIQGSLEGSSISLHFAGAGVVRPVQSAIPVLYPQWWGALGNTTNDTAAIQAALKAGVVGNPVRFPLGTYQVTTSLTIGSS